MKGSILLLCLAFIFSGTRVSAQLSKEETKEWKKKAKEMAKSPEALKELSEGKAAAEAEASKLKGEVKTLNASIADRDSRIGEMESLIAKMRTEAAVSRAELEKLRAAGAVATEMPGQPAPGKGRPAAMPSGNINSGVVFKVQIGAFKNKDMSKYFDNNPNFGGEAGKEPGEPQRISIGIFRNYWEADLFKKYMREMGVKDAWIVPYKDGKRVEIKDVLEMIVEKPAE
ncbi:MAG: Ezrin/radixin/moesin family protein [Bacteroidota bacterium]